MKFNYSIIVIHYWLFIFKWNAMVDVVNIRVWFKSLCNVTSEETLVVHIIVVIVKINRIEQKEYALSTVKIMNTKQLQKCWLFYNVITWYAKKFENHKNWYTKKSSSFLWIRFVYNFKSSLELQARNTSAMRNETVKTNLFCTTTFIINVCMD